MTQETFDSLTLDFVNNQVAVLSSKRDDYANEDVLSNFKDVAKITGTTPEQVALTLIAVKVARLGNLLSQRKNPNNESIYDSVLDLSNYSLLLNAIIQESKS